ncbi:MAG: xanthine dehydrogenase family protein molybdopterin-binding subunit [Alphaproteobacteria bacterium]|nr:xanthine dehydrogenase family protein molybdopterin-binding subunit [Alphaproteobacteria bacterium]MCB9930359.1 xanthine dehydrogenase family protein molybdopterin-binding subunit [Alphaproteobacteria bacterium]
MNHVTADNKWIGQRTIRPDGVDKVTGAAQYGADFTMPGMVWGKILRSPHAHALVKKIDTSKAAAMKGVVAVMTGDDLPLLPLDVPMPTGPNDVRWISRGVMAREKVLYAGHAIAAVAATSQEIAAAALDLIEVDYEVLPHVIDVDEAMAPGAPILHDWIQTKGVDGPTNISNIMTVKAGDVEAGFAESDLVLERTFRSSAVHQGYIEPQACIVSYKPDSQSTVWSSSQGQFMVRSLTALISGMATGDIKAIPAEIGGGFGGKTIIYLEPVAMILSKKSGRPVKIQHTREEVFHGTGPASGMSATLKVGVTKDGKLKSVAGAYNFQAGCYPGSPVGRACTFSFSSYSIPNADVKGLDVVSNRPNVTAYRGPGAPQGNYVFEAMLDEIADQLGLDPWELRRRNLIRPDEPTIYGAKVGEAGMEECIAAVQNHPNAQAKLGPNQGRGIAVGYWGNAGGESSAHVHINEDGTALVITGHPDIGGSRASMVNIVAEMLGIDYRKVRAQIGDTNNVGISAVTGGSRVTFAAAMVVNKATDQVINTLKSRAAMTWGIDPDAVEWSDGEARPAGANAGKFEPLSLAQLAKKAESTGGPITASVSLNTTGHMGVFGAHMVDVEVDRETGHVQVLRYTACQDVGRAIHPDYVEGQIQGGVVQGIGWALNEEYVYTKDGHVDNAGFLDYRMPVASDMPKIDTIMVEVPNPKHPYGVKGVGEIPLVPPLAAVANAVSHAIGKRLYELPMSPPKILAALDE